MLKMISVNLELISDTDMYLFVEKGMRECISYIGKRYSKANNKCMKSHGDCKSSKDITCLDASNLYSWAISQYLPIGELRWLIPEKTNTFDISLIPKDSSDGYVLETYLEYPDELHNLHNHRLLALKKLEISRDMLSNYSR